MHKPLRVSQVTLADGSPAFATTGAPSDCVSLALLGLVPQAPDPVSYTHLTLPKIYSVYISVVAGSLKKKAVSSTS